MYVSFCFILYNFILSIRLGIVYRSECLCNDQNVKFCICRTSAGGGIV